MSHLVYKIPTNEVHSERHKLFEKLPGKKIGTINDKIILSFLTEEYDYEYIVIPQQWIFNQVNQSR